MSSSESLDAVCSTCSKDALIAGLLEKRNGFSCAGCGEILHFDCAGFQTYNTGVLPKAVSVFFATVSVKIPLEKVLFCANCSPTEGEVKSSGNEDEEMSTIDVEAREAIQKLQETSVAISAKLDFIADFLTPPDSLTESNIVVEGKAPNQSSSYARVAQNGTSGFSGLLTQACVQAQKDFSEAELMKHTVIFDNLPEKGSDWNDAVELLHALYLSNIQPEETFRLGMKKRGKPRKLKVILRTIADKETVLGPQVRRYLRDSRFPFQGVYVNPSRPFEERKTDYLLRQRRKELNQGLNEDDQFFVYRAEQRLVKKENGQVDWNWKDDEFCQWAKDFEEKQERERESAKNSRQSQPPKQSRFPSSFAENLNKSEWQLVQGRRGRQTGNGRGGMRH